MEDVNCDGESISSDEFIVSGGRERDAPSSWTTEDATHCAAVTSHLRTKRRATEASVSPSWDTVRGVVGSEEISV